MNFAFGQVAERVYRLFQDPVLSDVTEDRLWNCKHLEAIEVPTGPAVVIFAKASRSIRKYANASSII